MDHAKEHHLICGINQCDAVFGDATSLDMHQAELHNRTVKLRIENKSDDEEVEEDKKEPTVTSEQYKRMNENNKNQHFPTLNKSMKTYTVNEAKKEGASGKKQSKESKQANPLGYTN